jgi:hypothetical protein
LRQLRRRRPGGAHCKRRRNCRKRTGIRTCTSERQGRARGSCAPTRGSCAPNKTLSSWPQLAEDISHPKTKFPRPPRHHRPRVGAAANPIPLTRLPSQHERTQPAHNAPHCVKTGRVSLTELLPPSRSGRGSSSHTPMCCAQMTATLKHNACPLARCIVGTTQETGFKIWDF